MDEIPLAWICPKSTSLSDPAFQLDSMTYLFESFRRSLPYLNSKVSFILVKYFCDLSHIFVLFSNLQQEYDVKRLKPVRCTSLNKRRFVSYSMLKWRWKRPLRVFSTSLFPVHIQMVGYFDYSVNLFRQNSLWHIKT